MPLALQYADDTVILFSKLKQNSTKDVSSNLQKHKFQFLTTKKSILITEATYLGKAFSIQSTEY